MNAQQLKDSILQYAMQGKLVPQDPNDEPVSILVKKILKEKENLFQRKATKKEEALIPINAMDIPFDIPESWEWVKLGEITLKNVGGGTPSKHVAEYWNGDIPWVSVKDIQSNIIEGSQDSITELGLKNSSSNLIEENNLIICTRMGLGKIAINKISIAINQDLRALYLPKDISKWFIVNYFKTLRITGKGATVKGISLNQLNNILIPLPPTIEQERIVERLEELFNKVDSYERNYTELKNLQTNFPLQLENSIVHYAMQGKLVEQDPNDEPAADLVKRIREEKERLIKEKMIKKEKTLSPIGDEEIPFDIPDSWEWVRLKELCQINPKNNVADNIESAFIPMKLIQDGFTNTHSFEKTEWNKIKKGYTHFQTGDIVVAKITPCFENLKSVIIQDLPNEVGAGTTELFVFRPYIQEINKEYLLWLFKSQYFIKGGTSSFSGTAGHQRVSKSYVENFLVPLPSVNEQKRIVEKINELQNRIQLLNQ